MQQHPHHNSAASSQDNDTVVSQEYGLMISQPLSQFELPEQTHRNERNDDEEQKEEESGSALGAVVPPPTEWVRPTHIDVPVQDALAQNIEPMLPAHWMCPDVQRADKPDFFRQVKLQQLPAADALSLSSSSSTTLPSWGYFTVRCWWRDPEHRGLPSQAPPTRKWVDDFGDIHDTPPVGWFVRCVSPAAGTGAATRRRRSSGGKKRARSSASVLDAIERQRKQQRVRRHSSRRSVAAVALPSPMGQHASDHKEAKEESEEQQQEEQKEEDDDEQVATQEPPPLERAPADDVVMNGQEDLDMTQKDDASQQTQIV